MVFSKSVSTLLRSSVSGNIQFFDWFFYVSIACLTVSTFFWINCINRGLQLFPAVTVIPLLQIFFTFMSVLSGAVYYREFAEFTRLQLIMFLIGIANMLAGIYLLAPEKPVPAPPPIEEDIKVEEIRIQNERARSYQQMMEAVQLAEAERESRRGSVAAAIGTATTGVRRSIINTAKSAVALGENKKMRAMSLFFLPVPYDSQEEEFSNIDWMVKTGTRRSLVQSQQMVKQLSFTGRGRSSSFAVASSDNSKEGLGGDVLTAEIYEDEHEDDFENLYKDDEHYPDNDQIDNEKEINDLESDDFEQDEDERAKQQKVAGQSRKSIVQFANEPQVHLLKTKSKKKKNKREIDTDGGGSEGG